jgi:hypothetical protein
MIVEIMIIDDVTANNVKLYLVKQYSENVQNMSECCYEKGI